MDEILAKASNHVVSFAIRSGISLASGFAVKTVSNFLDKIPENEKQKIILMKKKIQTKIDILSMSIDLIKFAVASGNSILENTLNLINELNEDIKLFEGMISDTTNDLNNTNEKESIRRVESYMVDLLERINDSIPILNLSLVTCGINLNRSLSNSISPSRLLQSSYYLNKSNDLFNNKDSIQVGPSFDLVFYSIFYNPGRLKYIKKHNKSVDELICISWKEDFARCLGKVIRIFDENKKYKYTLEVHENFNDNRFHESDEKPQVKKVNIDFIKKLFFTASGKLLRLESRNSPVLILKLVNDNNEEEWIGLGEVIKGEFDESEDDENNEKKKDEKKKDEKKKDGDDDDSDNEVSDSKNQMHRINNSSLSLLEYLIKLSKIQYTEEKSILGICDEKMSLYLKNQKNYSNNAFIQKSYRQKKMDSIELKDINNSITLDSNINRLENISI